LIGLIAFLTIVDLFATQAILPLLRQAYGVTPAAMALAVNASTIGMAVASLAVAFFSQIIDRRLGIILSITLLAIPTLCLAFALNLAVFAILRTVQSLCMASAFTLTLAYLGEQCSANDTAGAFAAYITGKVGSNLFGWQMSAAVADHFGLASNFFVFASLNLGGAIVVYATIGRAHPMAATDVQKLRLFYLPPYSPDRNPDELVWTHLKADTTGRMAVTSKDDFKAKVRSSMRQLQNDPGKISSFYQKSFSQTCRVNV
jgi:MFS family permease